MRNKSLLACCLLLFSAPLSAADAQKRYQSASPPNRVALLELYTSEGCSSCPPADQFLSGLKNSEIKRRLVVPLAFHITYWDYIGWKDRFAHEAFDRRQRRQALLADSRRIYTPQFLLNGSDYRRYRTFTSDVDEVNAQPAEAAIELDAVAVDNDSLEAGIRVVMQSPADDTVEHAVWLAVFENDLDSKVTDGENEGAHLHHDYVVRKLYGPYPVDGSPARVSQTVRLAPDWKKRDLGLAAFVQQAGDSKVLQAVSLMLE